MLIPPAFADSPGGALASLGAAGQILPLILVFAIFYFLLIRPNQQKQKQMKAMLQALKRGDRVVTGGGIVGIVQKTKDSEVEVEIAPNVRVTVLRDTISSVLTPSAPAAVAKAKS